MEAIDLFLDGAAASAAATVISNPFDVVRARMQVQGAMQTEGAYEVLYRNVPQAMLRVAREEGVCALQKGLASAVMWQVVMNGIRIGFYPEVKDTVRPWLTKGTVDTLPVCAAASALCGFAGSFVASPLNLVKTRLQLQRSVSATGGAGGGGVGGGGAGGYRGMLHGLQSVYHEGGVTGLWHGSFVSAQRMMMGSLSQLTAYDTVKSQCQARLGWQPTELRVHVVSAICASMFVVLTMTPLDVVSTRVYSTRKGSGTTYSSNLPLATWRIFKVEGVRGLYKGSTAFFSRSAPHTIVTFTVLEFIRTTRARNHMSYTGGARRTYESAFRPSTPADALDDALYAQENEIFVRTAGLFNM